MTRTGSAALTLLTAVYATVFIAGFVSPYDATLQNRDLPFAPPTRLHFVDAAGAWHVRPFVHDIVARPGTLDEYDEKRDRAYPVRFLVRGAPYRLGGWLHSDVHLFGVDHPAKIFVFGTDQYGRDVL